MKPLITLPELERSVLTGLITAAIIGALVWAWRELHAHTEAK